MAMKKIGAMNLILILVGAFLLLFTVAMVVVFLIKDAVPDTLITCVFSALGGECGIMGLIKMTKIKNERTEEDD